jgi:hypothetical protein
MLPERILALLTAAVIAISIGVGLIVMGSGSEKRDSGFAALLGPRKIDKGVARNEIETLIAATPEYQNYFARLRETFTSDYEAAIEDFAARRAETSEERSVDYYLSETVRRIRQSRGALAAKASPEAMAQVFSRQLEVLQAVAQSDKRLCVGFLYGATNLDFQNFAATQRPLVATMALASLEAMVDGQAKQLERERPNEADFKILETALVDRGLGQVEIDALLDGKMPNPPLEDAKMCAAGQSYFEVLRILPEPARARIHALALELMAKS